MIMLIIKITFNFTKKKNNTIPPYISTNKKEKNKNP